MICITFSCNRNVFQKPTYLNYIEGSPSSRTLNGLGSTLDKEIELFSKDPSILFDLSKVFQVNSQALSLNLPFNSSTSTF